MWRGDPSLPLAEQGVKVLGTPLGHTEFLKAQLREVINSHSILWERIPSVPDLQSAWLLLVFCTASRANYLLRSVPPDVADEYARDHDDAMRRCMSQLLDVEIPDESWAVASLPLSVGGLGLRFASRMSTPAYWASWADCLHTVQQRHPAVGDQISSALSRGAPGRYLDAAASCRERLLDVSFEAPPREDLQRGALPRQHELDDAEPGVKRHGWQFLSGALCPFPCAPPFARRPTGRFAIHVFPDCSTFPIRRSAFSGASPPSLVAHSSSFRSQLPVWPPTRFQWPSPRSLCSGRGSGSQGLRS